MNYAPIKSLIKSLTIVSIAACAMSAPGIVIAAEDELSDINSITCKEVLLASGEDRDGAILVLHAYLLGEAKQPKYDDNVLAAATDRLLDACVYSPDAKALATLREQIKAAD